MEVIRIFSENWECYEEGIDGNTKDCEERDDGSSSNKNQDGNTIESSYCETSILEKFTELVQNLELRQESCHRSNIVIEVLLCI